MTADLTVHDWKLLRMLVRAKGKPLTGRQLRHTPTAKTRTGAFLGRLVDTGLLAVAAPGPDPFAATYALTPLGRHAAEYGEYEVWLPGSGRFTGDAAEGAAWTKAFGAAAEPAEPVPATAQGRPRRKGRG